MSATGAALRVALVGYGFAAKVFHAPLVASVPGLELAAVVSSDAAKVRSDLPDVRVYADADDAFADPAIDLVVIATPNRTHAPLALRALSCGKHVVVDKPFTLEAGEARALAVAARETKRVLSVFQNRRYDGDFLTLRALIDDGSLGDVVRLESRFERFRPTVRDRWRERDEPGAGLWYDLGPHLVDQALVLFGRPTAVFADIARERDGARTDDAFLAVLRYPQRRVVVQASMLAAAAGPRFRALGTRATYTIDGLDAQEDALRAGGDPAVDGFGRNARDGSLVIGSERADGAETRAVPTRAGAYRRYYEALRDAIVRGTANPVPPEDGVAIAEILDAGRRSVAARSEIRL